MNDARSQRGVTLVETMVASAILIIVVAGLLPVFAVGIRTTNQRETLRPGPPSMPRTRWNSYSP